MPSATPPTPAEVLACLRTLEQLHALDDAALDHVPGAGAVLARYAREPDFDAWSARLRLRELDLCDLPAVERFALELRERNAPLDVLVNNAARTIDHPPAAGCFVEPRIGR